MSGFENNAAQEQVRATVERYSAGDRSATLAMLALIGIANETGVAVFHDVAVQMRADYISALRAEGRDADAEAGRLQMIMTSRRSRATLVVVPINLPAQWFDEFTKFYPSGKVLKLTNKQ